MASGEEDEVVLQESGRRSTRTTRAVATRRSRGRKKAATPRATRAKRNTRAAQSAESEDEEEEAQEEAEETTQESVEEQASPEAENDNEDDDEPLVVYNKSSEESIAVANGVEENNSNEQEEAEAVSSDKGAEGVSSDKGAEGVSSDKGVDEGEEANPEKNEQAKSDEEGRSEEGVPQRDIEDADTRDAPSDSPEARNTCDDQLENKSHGDEDKDADVNGKSEPENVEDEVGEIKPEKEADNEDSHSSRNVDDREVPELEESPPPSINMTSPLRPGLKIKMETSSISSIEESQGVSQEVEVKQDDSKTEEKQEDSKTEEKQDVSKTEEKQEDSKTEEKQDVSKSDGKQEVSKTEMKQDVFEETDSNQCKIIEETKGGQESNEESESDGRKKNKTVTKKEESKNQTKEGIKKQKKESKKKAKEESKKVVVEEPMEVDQETTGKEGSETIIREDPEAMDEDAGDKPENVEEMTVLDEVKEDEEKGEEAKEAGPGDADADGTFRTEPDTEMVSEDELPTETPKEPLETEAVSDEELPDPTAAVDLPETEAVSEDELPPEKTDKKKKKSTKTTEGSGKKKTRSKEAQKRKLIDGDTYDPSSPTSENSCDESPAAKRAAVASETGGIKAKAVAKKKSLPELEKYWKAVKEDPSDFTGWTYLLQYVDQENDIEAAREAYDAFLSHYPYCYGYWRKYADYEKRKGNKEKCEEVFERGLKAIPLSVDLWIHFLNYSKATYPDDEEHLRAQFEKAINACGMEFRSDRLWESFIKWETEGKRLQNVTSLYDRLLAMPTQGYTNHFDNFQEHISGNPPQKVLSVDEFLTLRREVLQLLKQYDQPAAVADDVPPGDEVEAPPGEEPEEQPVVKSDEETTALRERIVSIRRKVHKQTVTAVADRWNYEEGIKRPYFHVKPLERCQLKNWKEYLDFEIERGDHERIIILFERCLIACALYEEFWIKFIRYLESRKEEDMTDKIRNVYERACTIHHTKKPNLHLHWAVFEESHKNYEKASEILSNLEKLVPNMLQVAYRRINLERRCNNMEKVCSLYEHYISNTKNKVISNNMAIKFARFCWKVKADVEKAISILNKAVEKDKDNPRLYLQLIDMGLQQNPLNEENIISIIDQFLSRDTDPEQKVLFAQRKVEFLEDFGSDILSVQKAHDEFQRYLKQAKDRKKKSPDLDGKSIDSKKAKSLSDSSQAHTGHSASHGSPQPAHGTASQPPQPPSNSTAAATAAAGTGQYAAASYSQTGGYSQQPPSQSGYQGGQYPPAGPQQPPTPYSQPPYNQQYGQSSDPNYANYQNWGYSQTGYGGYNQGWGNYNYY